MFLPKKFENDVVPINDNVFLKTIVPINVKNLKKFKKYYSIVLLSSGSKVRYFSLDIFGTRSIYSF